MKAPKLRQHGDLGPVPAQSAPRAPDCPDHWPSVTVTGWKCFAALCERVLAESLSGETILFRGQSRHWPLRPKLIRDLPKEATPAGVLAAEQSSLDHFKSQAHLHDQPWARPPLYEAPSLTTWWSLMQHYQAPTRLLDWTASPYVAAYFAAEKDVTEPGEMYVIAMEAVDRCFRRRCGVSDPKPEWLTKQRPPRALSTFTTYYKTTRLLAQQGYFSMAMRVLDDHDELLAGAGAIRGRWVIPPNLKADILSHLRTMNVAANSLFPGLDGLGRSTTEIARLMLARGTVRRVRE